MSNSLQKLYSIRFSDKERKRKNDLWKAIYSYFEKFMPASLRQFSDIRGGIIVDVAAGYCDFINNIQCDCH